MVFEFNMRTDCGWYVKSCLQTMVSTKRPHFDLRSSEQLRTAVEHTQPHEMKKDQAF